MFPYTQVIVSRLLSVVMTLALLMAKFSLISHLLCTQQKNMASNAKRILSGLVILLTSLYFLTYLQTLQQRTLLTWHSSRLGNNDKTLREQRDDHVTTPHLRFKADPIPNSLFDFVDDLPIKPLKPKEKKCMDILYIKTHKTGSETVATMFRRFGLRNNLTFARPIGNYQTRNNLGWPWTFKKSYVHPSKTGKFNILCDHSIFTGKEMYDIMNEDVVTVASLRDPFSHMKSAFSYFKMQEYARMKNTINTTDTFEEFLLDMAGYDKIYKENSAMCVPHHVSVTQHAQARDLGFPLGFQGMRDQSQNVTFIYHFLESISSQVNIPLITEYFNHSLILMKRILRWSHFDILYSIRNPTNKSKKHKTYSIYPEHIRQNALKWNYLDVLLHRLMNRTLWENIKHMPDFNEELDHFEKTLSMVVTACNRASLQRNIPVLTVPASTWDDGFIVRSTDCYRMSASLQKEIHQLIESNVEQKYKQPKVWHTIPGC